MAISFILASVPLAWRCFTAHRLFRSYQRALKLNVLIFYALFCSDNFIWLAFQTAFPVIFDIILLSNTFPSLQPFSLVVVGRIWKFGKNRRGLGVGHAGEELAVCGASRRGL